MPEMLRFLWLLARALSNRVESFTFVFSLDLKVYKEFMYTGGNQLQSHSFVASLYIHSVALCV